MRSQGLLLILLRLSATALIPSAQEGSTTAGLQLASAWPMSTWSQTSPTRRLSWADRTSGDYHKPPSAKADEEADDSDAVSVRPARASPYKVAAVSEDDEEDTSSTNSASASSSDHSSRRKKRTQTTKDVNSSEPMQPLETGNTSTSYYSTTPTVSQWDSANVTFDPSNTTTNSTLIIPLEQAQPDSWPVIVFGIFALLALGLCSVTAIKSCKNSSKRKNYDEIESLVV